MQIKLEITTEVRILYMLYAFIFAKLFVLFFVLLQKVIRNHFIFFNISVFCKFVLSIQDLVCYNQKM